MNEVPQREENETIESYVERVKASALLRGNAVVVSPGHLYQLKNFEGLYEKFPSEETLAAIAHLEKALDLFELRTIRRIARGVEGKHIV
jgi:hypothetical protein